MRLKPVAIEIDPDDIFKHDKLDREKTIINLSAIFKNINESFVFIINAPYGQGKTTFVKFWSHYLKKIDINTIIFNAWESDYVDNSLACLIAELRMAMEAKLKLMPEKKKTLASGSYEKFLEISGKVIKTALPAIVKIAASGILKIDDFREDMISNFLEKTVQTTIEEYSKTKDLLKEFKEILRQNTKIIAGEKPLFIFIDELDRCRPNYAIEVLETIKHLFDIDGIIFVLSLDERQIKTSIKHIYGEEIDADGYLKRFIDMSFTLPNPRVDDYCHELFYRFDVASYFKTREEGKSIIVAEKAETIEKHFIFLMQKFNLTLREAEKIFTTFVVILQMTPPINCLYPEIIFLLILIYKKNYFFYKKIITKEVQMNEIMAFFSKELTLEEDKILNPEFGIFLNSLVCLDCALNDDDMKFYKDLENRYQNSENILKILTQMKERKDRIFFSDRSFSSVLKNLDAKFTFLNNIEELK
ncbi:MAG: P-loop NTPase fold protein [Candidatus Omnitrophota bacterium]